MGFSLILRAFFSFPNERQFIECQFFWEFRKRCGEKITNQKGCSVAERDAGIPVIVVAAVKETIS